MYKYKTILDKIREVLLPYSLEAKGDLATCMLSELVPHIEIIAGQVQSHNHIFAYDSKEKYYIDITSEKFGFPPCLCSQDKKDFETLGYVIPSNFHTWNGVIHMFEQLKQGPVLIDNGNEVTLDQLLAKIKKKRWTFFNGTRKKR